MRRPQNFRSITLFLKKYKVASKKRGWFRKILWPSQNIWTLKTSKTVKNHQKWVKISSYKKSFFFQRCPGKKNWLARRVACLMRIKLKRFNQLWIDRWSVQGCILAQICIVCMPKRSFYSRSHSFAEIKWLPAGWIGAFVE